jgi:hypothetical protein
MYTTSGTCSHLQQVFTCSLLSSLPLTGTHICSTLLEPISDAGAWDPEKKVYLEDGKAFLAARNFLFFNYYV